MSFLPDLLTFCINVLHVCYSGALCAIYYSEKRCVI